MSKSIFTLVLLFQLFLTAIGLCDQKTLDADRTRKLQTVFESIRRGNNGELVSCLPGLSKEEATKILKKIEEHWGDTAKLVRADGDMDSHLSKGKMKLVVQWGSKTTQIGCWFRLNSPTFKGTEMRIGLLFAKGSSEPRQFHAVEWDSSDVPKK